MTFDECRKTIEGLRQKQGTDRPVVRVDYGGACYKGMLARVEGSTDPSAQPGFGVLVLQEPGLARSPQTYLQIAGIRPGGISDVSDN